MQSPIATVQISAVATKQDQNLLDTKKKLENIYWLSRDGIFEFQFQTDSQPLTLPNPMYFNIIRYTPDIYNMSFMLSIPGVLNQDGSFNYGGGRQGKLIDNNTINFTDGGIWTAIKSVPQIRDNPLNLNKIVNQAILDSWIMGNISQSYYW